MDKIDREPFTPLYESDLREHEEAEMGRPHLTPLAPIQSGLEKRFQSLDPLVRNYLHLHEALKIPSLSESLRDNLSIRRAQALEAMVANPRLQLQFRDYVVFKSEFLKDTIESPDERI